jgi:LmbE family N-acetylglucosaminyl deacetylase
MAGGLICKYVNEGSSITGLIFTDGSWMDHAGIIQRESIESIKEAKIVANFLKYELIILSNPALAIHFTDNLVSFVLKIIEGKNIDTLVLPWYKDIHPDHKVVSEIGIAASRRIPRVLFGQINYFVNDFFTPNLYIDITPHFQRKIEALSLFHSVWSNNSEDWTEFMTATHTYYGKLSNTKFAEGFLSNKFLLY